ncbi:MAG: hypothetical protein PF486_03215 [Prolixibacteraceae bacterium]|nr:hypothetical protein [Prolixibacteraceae bacterium]
MIIFSNSVFLEAQILQNSSGVRARKQLFCKLKHCILNPVIRGWSNYHKGVCSKRIFARLGTFIHWQLKRRRVHK